ncbi:SGNH/GDSL hydrolase family protein [Devosia beringensis]|uniref:SGNH/GDSL hydrolase family protein n=1 Tax=Devosia beringensis TaxID=2657486 RepID=UPI00186B62DD|nr:SGNH/GDSL hydrolase family protein [Devosia beringensis]
MTILTPKSVYRNWEVDGVPTPGTEHKPKKSEIVQLLEQIQASSLAPAVVRETLADLELVTPAEETYGGQVLNDPEPDNNGYYFRAAGDWVKGRGFPDTAAELVEVEGTANAVLAGVEAGVNPADIKVWFIEPLLTNSDDVVLNGFPVRNVNGDELAPGEWPAGRLILLVNRTTEWRLLSDPDADAAAAASAASAVIADTKAGEASDSAAEAAGYAAGLNIAPILAGDAGKVLQVNGDEDGSEWVGLAPFTGDSGTGGVAGLVPAPAAGYGAAGRVLGANGLWVSLGALGGASAPSLRQRVIDFHFGCARGVGFISGVDSGTINYTLSSGASKGALSFAYTGTAPGSGQLIVLLGTDAEYYTVVVASSTGGTCSLLEPLPCNVASGQNAWSFWDNNAHPNSKGYAAIADYGLRQDLAVWRKIYQRPPRIDPPATVVVATSNAFSNPGSANSNFGWTVTPSGAGGGAYWQFKPKMAGIYRLVFECNKVSTGSADIDLAITHAGTTIASGVIKTATAGRHEFEFYAPGEVAISLTRTATAFLVSNMQIFQLEEMPIAPINYGSHMVLGDSWVFDPVGPAARLAARLTSATVADSGVGGNKVADLLARFDADVTAAGPFDYVWVVVGTNDIAGSDAPATFSVGLAALINKIQAIGATPIIFTPYTGCTDVPTRIDFARRYMADVPYYEQTLPTVVRHSVAVYAPASLSAPILSLGIQNAPFYIRERYMSHAIAVNEGASHTALTTLTSLTSGFDDTPVLVTPDPNGKFVQLVRSVGGAAEFINGYVDIETLD